MYKNLNCKGHGLIQKYRLLPDPVKASFWFLICLFVQKAISLITMPIFTRVMSTSDFGQYSIYNSWLGLITVFSTFNLSWGVFTQGLIKYEADRKVYTSSMNGLSTLLIAIAFLVYIIFQKSLNALFGLNSRLMYLMFLSIWATSTFEFWSSVQKVKCKYRLLVFITICVSVANPLLSLFFMYIQEDQVFGRVLGITVVSLVAYTWMFVVQIYEGKHFFNSKYWKKSIKIGIPLIPHYLSQTALNSADRIMIGQMVSQSSAGIYSVAYTASSVMGMFNSALLQTMSPWIYRKIRDKEIDNIAPIAYTALIFIAFVNLLLIAFAPEVLYILAPPEYYDAIWIIPPVAMSIFFMFEYDLFAKFEFYFERTKLISTMTMLGALLNIILNYIFIKLFGYYAAGYTTLLCYVIYAVLHYISMRKICDDYCESVQPYSTAILSLIACVFLVAGFGLMALYKHVVLRYVCVFAILLFGFYHRKAFIQILNKLR